MKLIWENIRTYHSKDYTCGHCSSPIASEKAFIAKRSDSPSHDGAYIYICHQCSKPTFFDILDENKQIPGPSFGNDVNDIDDKSVEELYNEARRCYSTNAFTSAVLSSRKLLMHIAVSKGAALGLKFIEYVEYFSANNYIPPDAKDWVTRYV